MEGARADKILDRINKLANVSEDPGCITRTYGTPAFIKGRQLFEHWMREAGLETRIDNIGNVRARLETEIKGAKTFVIGSHIDTIINAGKFDGPLGVLIGLEIIEGLKRSGIDIPFNIELIAFCDEEGCRFHSTYLGSAVVAGSFDDNLLDVKDKAGISLRQVIESNGGDVNKLSKDAIAKQDWLGYFEIHIEQGPVLFERNVPVGIVTAIAGQYRAGVVFNGVAGHAGTVPMNMRRDALACAAEFILLAENVAKESEGAVVATVGKTHIINAASNVIPGEVICSLDARSADAEKLDQFYHRIKAMTVDLCRKRNIVPEWSFIQGGKPVTCDARMRNLLKEAVGEAGYEVIELVSGAGHDAVPISGASPVSMLFVKCFKGISHNPDENVEADDIAAAIKVSDNFIRQLISQYGK